MFWTDKTVADIQEKLAGKIKAGKTRVVRDEKTASGRVHVGSMRGVAIHGTVAQALNQQGVPAVFKYEINDFDPMDGLPVYLNKDEYEEHMGKQLYSVPSPDKKAENFAEYYASEFKGVIQEAGFEPEYYRASELYRSGKMNDVIRTALLKAADIRRIYKETSGAVKDERWLPLSVVCDKCGKVGTTKAVSFDGEKVAYECQASLVEWAHGCGHTGEVSPFDGNAKLPWKVEWAAKFKVLGVDIEGGGKDHSTKGGARDVANHISREVFGYEPPYDIPYEFFLVAGKKMSSSKGAGSSAREVADLMPAKIFRLALIGKEPMRAFNFDPEGNTLALLYDRYDEIAEKFWNEAGDDDTRLFELLRQGKAPERMFSVRFSQVAFIVQMPHLSLTDEAARLKGSSLSSEELAELNERSEYAAKWVKERADEQYVYQLYSDSLPDAAKRLNAEQKAALQKVAEYIEAHDKLSGEELHHALHEIKKESGIEPKELFSAIYRAFLGRDSGPQAGWFLSVLDREFLLRRLKEVAQ